MPVNTTFRHPLFAQIIKYSNIRYGRNISGTDCIPEKNERLVLDEIVSIYKPYWICKYNGKKIFLDA